MKEQEKPLWRIVRSILNPIRLRMLRVLYTMNTPMCVREIARMFRIGDSVTSIYLRQLNECGLLGVERHEIKVFYFCAVQESDIPENDMPCRSTDRHSVKAILNGEVGSTIHDKESGDDVRRAHEDLSFPMLASCLKDYFRNELPDGWEMDLMTVLRAFSHFNRLAMLQRLMRGDVAFDDLKLSIGTCVKTFEHHLEFLYAADLIEVVRNGRREGTLHLCSPLNPVARALLQILAKEEEIGVSYRNVVHLHDIDTATRTVIRRIGQHEGNLGDGWIRKGRMSPIQGRMTKEVIAAMREVDDAN